MKFIAPVLLIAFFNILLFAQAPVAGTEKPLAEKSGLSAGAAVLLGIVEGLTEYLPVSSTGHLLLTQKLLGLGEGRTKESADAYAICIQAGAILAVLLLYRGRVRQMLRGLVGRDRAGLRLSLNLIAAFLPAVIIGVLFEHQIKAHLFGIWPIVFAWATGGVVILVIEWWRKKKSEDRSQKTEVRRQKAEEVVRSQESGVRMEELNPQSAIRNPQSDGLLENLALKHALIIGLIQCLAMWPGTSRSLVTILGGLLVGLSVPAAVEFSFLLGLVTLTAATGYEGMKYGHTIFADYGLFTPALGFIFAFIAAVAAVKWMVTYLQRHGLLIFGIYRILVAALVMGLVLAGVIAAR